MAQLHSRGFQRGDVYYISYNNTVGSEQGIGRPGLIVSRQKECDLSSTLLVVYLTTRETAAEYECNVEINSLKRQSWALCNQLACVDKSRCQNYYGTLTRDELTRVDKALGEVLGIPYGIVSDTSEMDALDKKLRKIELENRDVAAERDFYRELYEASLRLFAKGRLTQDLSKIGDAVEVSQSKQTPQIIFDAEEDYVELNTCSAADLRRCGMADDVIIRVINARPFTQVDDLRLVPGITRIGWQLLKNKVYVEPVKTETVPEPEEEAVAKLNINTASLNEIVEVTGISRKSALHIVALRNRKKFTCIEELLAVPGCTVEQVENMEDVVCFETAE